MPLGPGSRCPSISPIHLTHTIGLSTSLSAFRPPAAMPAKTKGAGSKTKEAEPKQQQQTSAQPPSNPQTVREAVWQRYWATNPNHKIVEEHGLAGLSPADKRTYLNLELVRSPDEVEGLSKKGQRELWKQLSEANVPLRSAPRPRDDQWGQDKNGRDIGDYTLDEYAAYEQKKSRIRELRLESKFFRRDRERAHCKTKNHATGEIYAVTEDSVRAERGRRQEMASLRNELYGVKPSAYANDPQWDDVVPIPQDEPEGALAAIAYADNYAEAMAYLRAVMAVKEHSMRCLLLTEHIIQLNPSHYTVWLYRFDIVKGLNIFISEELEWLNAVSLENLKNYQIWHHRQLLIDLHLPTIQSDEAAVTALARDEQNFLTEILGKDTKNYHVWSYRQYIVRKLGLWDSADEMRSTELMITKDVRNNSAWSHRFFLVFGNPAQSTPDSHGTEHDPRVPADIIDREIAYAQEKIGLAPQNQSPWNYLRGVLVKGGRPLGSVREFAESFVTNLGEGEDEEEVRSSHALDLLADIYKEAGEKEKADLCLRRLSEKWDRIREGYWAYRRRMLET
ncbi:putative geranylgeranyltransferase type I alpha subunit [Xylaria palmicola]|nr:putative geranylgeranyltransferase type I alpha subunit [Xylaria palmicola]